MRCWLCVQVDNEGFVWVSQLIVNCRNSQMLVKCCGISEVPEGTLVSVIRPPKTMVKKPPVSPKDLLLRCKLGACERMVSVEQFDRASGHSCCWCPKKRRT